MRRNYLKIFITLILFFNCTLIYCLGQTSDISKLMQWSAGEKVSIESVEKFGIEKCFSVSQISDDIFERIYKKSFKMDCTTKREELRYIKALHINAQGETYLGELICNKAISQKIVEILQILYNNFYPIERMVLIDNYGADDQKSMAANNSSGFNFRHIAGTNKLSNHSTGMAIDINPLQNPYVKRRKNGSIFVDPKNSTKYTNRELNLVYMIKYGDLCYQEFTKRGFVWGGNWKSVKDYQHFEYKKTK